MSKTVKMSDLELKRAKSIRLPKEYMKWFRKLPQNYRWWWSLSGMPFTGKSTWLFKLCGYLTRDGKVLYCNYEEKTEGGTIAEKVRSTRISMRAKKNIYFLNGSNIDDMTNELDTGKYKYCIIDSVSSIANGRKLEQRFKDICAGNNDPITGKNYEQIRFITVHHYSKGKFGVQKGSTDFEHIPDIVAWLDRIGDKSVATFKKNRFLGKYLPSRFDVFGEKIYVEEENDRFDPQQKLRKQRAKV